MFAAFLKDTDGSFAVARFIFSLVGAALALVTLFWFLPSAIRSGRIPFFAGWGMTRIVYIKREKGPLYFWFVFALYCLLIPAGVDIAIKGCFGPGYGFL
jgi:hypothetical protein